MKNFAIFILTHGRPNTQYTYSALRESGYTGTIILLLDDEDNTYSQYKNSYQNDIIRVFNKQYYIDNSDTGLQNPQRKCILYAKNAADDIARELGLLAYVVADDDILRFRHRWKEDGVLYSLRVRNMDKVVSEYAEFIYNNNIAAVSFGDIRIYIGGNIKVERIPYNFVFVNTAIKYKWHSAMYEDTITPILENNLGKLTLELPQIQYDMKPSDNNASGGMTDVYNMMSIYSRAGMTMLYHPSCVKYANNLVGFELSKDKAFPKLVSGGYKK